MANTIIIFCEIATELLFIENKLPKFFFHCILWCFKSFIIRYSPEKLFGRNIIYTCGM